MFININPFVAGVIATIAVELIAFSLTVMYIVIKHFRKTRRNASR